MAASPHAIVLPPGVHIEIGAARAVAQVMRVGMAAFEEHTGDPVPPDMQAICRMLEEAGRAIAAPIAAAPDVVRSALRLSRTTTVPAVDSVTTEQAADMLGVKTRRVRQLAERRVLLGVKVGAVWSLERASVVKLATKRNGVGPWTAQAGGPRDAHRTSIHYW